MGLPQEIPGEIREVELPLLGRTGVDRSAGEATVDGLGLWRGAGRGGDQGGQGSVGRERDDLAMEGRVGEGDSPGCWGCAFPSDGRFLLVSSPSGSARAGLGYHTCTVADVVGADIL